MILRSARGDTLPRSALSCSVLLRLVGSSEFEGGIVRVCSMPGESWRLRMTAREAVGYPSHGRYRKASRGLVSEVGGCRDISPSCVPPWPHRIPFGRESNHSGLPDARLVTISSLDTLAVSCPVVLLVILDGRESQLYTVCPCSSHLDKGPVQPLFYESRKS